MSIEGASGKKYSAALDILRSGRKLDPKESELWKYFFFFPNNLPFLFPCPPSSLPLSSFPPSLPSYTFIEHLLSANHCFRLWQSLVNKISIVLTLGKLKSLTGETDSKQIFSEISIPMHYTKYCGMEAEGATGYYVSNTSLDWGGRGVLLSGSDI